MGGAKTVTAGYHKNYAASLLNFGTSGTFIMEKEIEPKIIQNPHGFQKGGVKDVCPTVTSSDFHENNFLAEPQQKVLEQAQAICSKLRGGSTAKFKADGTIRGVKPKERDSHCGNVSEMVVQYEANAAQTLTTAHEPKCYGETTGWRIRKLTPRECMRLMNVDDSDIDKMIAAGIPKTQLYKLAGNSIVVNCLYHIFRKMFAEQGNENQQLELF